MQSTSRGIIGNIGVGFLYLVLCTMYLYLIVYAGISNIIILFTYTLIISIIFYAFILILFKKLFCYENREYLHKKINMKMGAYTFILGVGFTLFSCITSFFINKYFNTNSFNKAISPMLSSLSWVIIYSSIIGPLCEEFVMRGIVLGGLLKKYSSKLSIVISSVIFGIIHMNPLQFITAFVMGLLLGTVYVKYKSLILCMIIHCVNNIMVAIATYMPDKISYLKLSENNFFISLIFSFIGVIVMIIMIIFLNKENKKCNYESMT